MTSGCEWLLTALAEVRWVLTLQCSPENAYSRSRLRSSCQTSQPTRCITPKSGERREEDREDRREAVEVELLAARRAIR